MRQSFARGAELGLHAHREAQLIFAVSGAMQVSIESGRWLVPPQLAVWAPCRLPHAIDMLSQVEMLTIYYDEALPRASDIGVSLDRAFALHVTPLLKHLILALFQTQADSDRAQMILGLMLSELSRSSTAPTYLPLPRSNVGKRVTDLALMNLNNPLTIEQLADRAATSTRTISRLFPNETGLTFRSWLQRAKIVAAIDELTTGKEISEVASNCGFSSGAAFSFAFRAVTGMAPSDFLRKIDEGEA